MGLLISNAGFVFAAETEEQGRVPTTTVREQETKLQWGCGGGYGRERRKANLLYPDIAWFGLRPCCCLQLAPNVTLNFQSLPSPLTFLLLFLVTVG